MLDSLKNALTAIKEGALEAGAKAYFNPKVQKFGTITKIQVDTKQQTIFVEAELKGETGAVSVTICGYKLILADTAHYIVLERFEGSREWVAAVLNEFVAGRRLKIPPTLAAVL